VTAARKLPLWAVLARAFVLPWEQGGRLLRVVILPLGLFIALQVAWALALLPETSLIEGVWQLASSLCMAWLAVGIHRHVIIGERGVTNGSAAVDLRRVVLYAIAITILWALFKALALVFSDVYDKVLIGEAAESMQRLDLVLEKLRGGLLATLVSAVVIAFFGARFCLLLPAISIDASVSAALQAARGNTLRLAVVFSVLPVALGLLVGLLDMESSPTATVLGCVLWAIFLVIEVAALSLSWRELTSLAPLPTDQPA
jgi:hypothetical protein